MSLYGSPDRQQFELLVGGLEPDATEAVARMAVAYEAFDQTVHEVCADHPFHAEDESVSVLSYRPPQAAEYSARTLVGVHNDDIYVGFPGGSLVRRTTFIASFLPNLEPISKHLDETQSPIIIARALEDLTKMIMRRQAAVTILKH